MGLAFWQCLYSPMGWSWADWDGALIVSWASWTCGSFRRSAAIVGGHGDNDVDSICPRLP